MTDIVNLTDHLKPGEKIVNKISSPELRLIDRTSSLIYIFTYWIPTYDRPRYYNTKISNIHLTGERVISEYTDFFKKNKLSFIDYTSITYVQLKDNVLPLFFFSLSLILIFASALIGLLFFTRWIDLKNDSFTGPIIISLILLSVLVLLKSLENLIKCFGLKGVDVSYTADILGSKEKRKVEFVGNTEDMQTVYEAIKQRIK
jgi:hypothetical protein